MALRLMDLVRAVSQQCDDVIDGIASGGSTTTLVDSNLTDTYSDDDIFNGGVIILNEGGGNMVFVSTCETVPPGDFTAVTVTDNDCKMHRDKTYAKKGSWSYKFLTGADLSDESYISKTLASTYTTLYAQVHAYVTAAWTGTGNILQLQTAAGVAILSVKLSAGSLSIYNHVASESYTPTSVALSTGSQHRLELAVVISATVGTVDLWLDEVQIYSGRALNTGATAVGKIVMGILGTTIASAKTIYIDELRVDADYIGTRQTEIEKTISDYAGVSGTYTWVGAVTAPTTDGTRYRVYDWRKTRWSKEQKKEKINDAIATMWPYWYKEVTDPATDSGAASLSTTRGTFHYALPAACEDVIAVWIQSTGTNVPYQREQNWLVDGPSGQKYLRLNNAASFISDKKIRLRYIARPVRLETDNDELLVDAAWEGWAKCYIVASALSALWRTTSSPSDDALPMSKTFKADAQEIQLRHPQPMPQRTIIIESDTYSVPWRDRILPIYGG